MNFSLLVVTTYSDIQLNGVNNLGEILHFYQ